MASTDERHSHLYQQFDINSRYDDPGAYGESESWFGDGDYPPDWGERRNAVASRDNGYCRRCGRDTERHESAHTHHLTPLSEGGHNDLSNLVTLCTPCHAVRHPTNEDIDADPRIAPVFPIESAPDSIARVAPVVGHEFGSAAVRQLELLELVTANPSWVDRTAWNREQGGALRKKPYYLPPEVARRLPEEMPALLSEYDLVGDDGEQVLVIGAVRKDTGERLTDATIAVETPETDLRRLDHTTPGVARVSLPAETDEATVWVDHRERLMAATVALDERRPTVFLTRRKYLGNTPPKMAPPWRDRRGGESAYDPTELDRVATTREATPSPDPDPLLWLLVGVVLYFAATALHPLFWVVYAAVGLLGAYSLGAYVAGDAE